MQLINHKVSICREILLLFPLFFCPVSENPTASSPGVDVSSFRNRRLLSSFLSNYHKTLLHIIKHYFFIFLLVCSRLFQSPFPLLLLLLQPPLSLRLWMKRHPKVSYKSICAHNAGISDFSLYITVESILYIIHIFLIYEVLYTLEYSWGGFFVFEWGNLLSAQTNIYCVVITVLARI